MNSIEFLDEILITIPEDSGGVKPLLLNFLEKPALAGELAGTIRSTGGNDVLDFSF